MRTLNVQRPTSNQTKWTRAEAIWASKAREAALGLTGAAMATHPIASLLVDSNITKPN
jgi:hypothetical protein